MTGNSTARPPVVTQLVAGVRIVRPLTCIMAGISPVCGLVLAGGSLGAAGALAALAMACVMSVANTVNDIVDLPVDRAAKAGRPLPSGRLTVAQAWAVAGFLAAVAVGAAAELGRWAVCATAALLALSVLYSYQLKSTVLAGNATVAAVCAGTLLVGAGGHLTRQVVVAAATIFLFVLAYEIAKTLQDRDADADADLTTLATRHGPTASVLVYALTTGALAVVALGCGPAISAHALWYLLAVSACLVGPVLASIVLLARGLVARCLTVLRLTWLPALLSLLLLA